MKQRAALAVMLVALVGSASCKRSPEPTPQPQSPQPSAPAAEPPRDPWESAPAAKDPLPRPLFWSAEKDGKTRKAAAERELDKALRALAPSVAFNVIPYTAAPIPWQERLAPASAKNVAAALAFFEKRADRGPGNFWDAMELALADPDVDSLVMLGDGAPTGGTRWNVELMRRLFAEENRFRLVSLSAVLVECPKGLTRTWTAWCEETGGRVLSTELR